MLEDSRLGEAGPVITLRSSICLKLLAHQQPISLVLSESGWALHHGRLPFGFGGTVNSPCPQSDAQEECAVSFLELPLVCRDY